MSRVPKNKKASAPVRRFIPVSVPSQNPVPQVLVERLKQLSWRYVRIRSREWFAIWGMVALVLITVQMVLDWLVELALPVRVVILVADLTWLGFSACKHILPLFLRRLSLDNAALLVEKKWPFLRGKMIATVQMAEARFTHDSSELIGLLQQQTEALTRPLNFNNIIPSRTLTRLSWLAGFLTVFWVATMIVYSPGSIALLERVFLFPVDVPRQTRVICLSQNKIIATGDGFFVEAQALGITPSRGRVTMTNDSGQIQEVNLEKEEGKWDVFGVRVERIEEPFSYLIHLNDGISETYRVITVPRPGIASIVCEQTFPPYTGQGKVKRTMGDLSLLAGSTLDIHAVGSCSIVQAQLRLIGLDQEQVMTIGGPRHDELFGTIHIPATKLEGFSIHLTSDRGVSSSGETEYRIDIMPDHPPTIQVTYPQQLQELNTVKATPTIAFTATDDFGLAKIALKYRVIPEASHHAAEAKNAPPPETIEMDLPHPAPLSIKAHYDWKLPQLPIETTLEYWLEAKDNNDVTGPGIGESEHHTIKLVTEQEKKAEVFKRLLDSLNTVSDLSHSQEKINQDLGQAIQGKP